MKINPIHLWTLLIAALLIRLLSLGTYPLMDTTEARYGEMARLMVETGNWLTPQFDYGVPFWGKPPLFTWMSASGIELLGVNEFAVRTPHWLAGVLVIVLMAWFARRQGYDALVTALVLATCGLFSIAAGAVMTDMALTLGMTLAMLGFYLCWLGERRWGYIGFVGLAIGLLAKGPVVLVLVGLAVMPWLFLQHGVTGAWRVLWRRFPLIGGTLLMSAIALPWYVLAEQATPGFLDYFIVGEHFKRFVVSGWQGDLYGSAHDEPRGMIWLFWLASAAPWSVVLPVMYWRKRKHVQTWACEQKQLLSFLALWLVSPMLLFTMAGNILPAYVLPGVPALGLLIAMVLCGSRQEQLWFKVTAGVVPLLLIVAVGYLHFGPSEKRSDKAIWQLTRPGVATFYVGKRPFSGQFYSHGLARKLASDTPLEQYSRVQLIGKEKEVDHVVAEQKLTCVVAYAAKSGRALYQCVKSS